jgi:hypothetical protein
MRGFVGEFEKTEPGNGNEFAQREGCEGTGTKVADRMNKMDRMLGCGQ